jgi:hypothetical protein
MYIIINNNGHLSEHDFMSRLVLTNDYLGFEARGKEKLAGGGLMKEMFVLWNPGV